MRALALATRKLVLDVIPDARETADPPDKLIGYGFGPKTRTAGEAGVADLVCVIMPLQKGVNLGITGGATLPDPSGLLSGTASTAWPSAGAIQNSRR